jgi:hypothetical protein
LSISPTTEVNGFGVSEGSKMVANSERRTEQRLSYHWPIWFAENFNEELIQGQMADVSSYAAAFTCYNHEWCPYQGQWITARFSVPRYSPDGAFDMVDFVRSGHVNRVDSVNGRIRRIAVRFAQPLPFKPGEHPFIAIHSDSASQAELSLA